MTCNRDKSNPANDTVNPAGKFCLLPRDIFGTRAYPSGQLHEYCLFFSSFLVPPKMSLVSLAPGNKLNGHIPGHLGALCHWQECHSPGDKSISHIKDFKTTILRHKNYIGLL